MKAAAALMFGVLFAWGLGISGMSRPEVVLGFLDILGAWNPALMFVMGSAVPITLLRLWPPCGAARHLGVGARLPFRDKWGEQREPVALCLLSTSQGGASTGRVLIGRHARPAAESHHAASRSSSSAVISTGSSGWDRKASR